MHSAECSKYRRLLIYCTQPLEIACIRTPPSCTVWTSGGCFFMLSCAIQLRVCLESLFSCSSWQDHCASHAPLSSKTTADTHLYNSLFLADASDKSDPSVLLIPDSCFWSRNTTQLNLYDIPHPKNPRSKMQVPKKSTAATRLKVALRLLSLETVKQILKNIV